MTISELNNRLTDSLKLFIRKEGYVDSGDLVKSIKFKSTFREANLKLKLVAVDYIVYLDDGDLLNRFYQLDSTKSLIQEFLATNINLDL